MKQCPGSLSVRIVGGGVDGHMNNPDNCHATFQVQHIFLRISFLSVSLVLFISNPGSIPIQLLGVCGARPCPRRWGDGLSMGPHSRSGLFYCCWTCHLLSELLCSLATATQRFVAKPTSFHKFFYSPFARQWHFVATPGHQGPRKVI